MNEDIKLNIAFLSSKAAVPMEIFLVHAEPEYQKDPIKKHSNFAGNKNQSESPSFFSIYYHSIYFYIFRILFQYFILGESFPAFDIEIDHIRPSFGNIRTEKYGEVLGYKFIAKPMDVMVRFNVLSTDKISKFNLKTWKYLKYENNKCVISKISNLLFYS